MKSLHNYYSVVTGCADSTVSCTVLSKAYSRQTHHFSPFCCKASKTTVDIVLGVVPVSTG